MNCGKNYRKRAILIFVETLSIRRFVSLHYIYFLKHTSHINISNHCNSKLSKDIHFEKVVHFYGFSSPKNLQDDQGLKVVF